MTMPILPDWQQGMYLIGQDPDGAPILVQTDPSGNIVAVFKGEGPAGLDTIALDGAGRIIAVIRDPTSDNYIAIDDAGNITGVFQGMGPAGLMPLKTDVEGRLIALLTDPIDVWGIYRAMGLSELSARLAPQIPIDHRGDIVYQDDFESGVDKWQGAGAGTDYKVAISTTLARSGAYSVKMVGGSTGSYNVQLSRRLPFEIKGLMGLGVNIALVSDIDSVQIWYYIYDGTNYSQFALKLDPVTDKIYYYTVGPDWAEVADERYDLAADAGFIPIKMVFDTVNDKYIRAMVNGVYHDMTDMVPYTGSIGSMKYCSIMIYIKGTAGNNAVAYVDDVFVTQMEPANPAE